MDENWTRRDALILSREVCDLQNKIRQDPGWLVPYLKGYLRLWQRHGRQDFQACEEAILFCQNHPGVHPLEWSEALHYTACDHVDDQGPTGAAGHESSDGSGPKARFKRYGDAVGPAESISYSSKHAFHIMIGLIVDDGVRSRWHRLGVFNEKYRHVGVAVGHHSKYDVMCVIDYARVITPNENKRTITPYTITGGWRDLPKIKEDVANIRKAKNAVAGALRRASVSEIPTQARADASVNSDDREVPLTSEEQKRPSFQKRKLPDQIRADTSIDSDEPGVPSKSEEQKRPTFHGAANVPAQVRADTSIDSDHQELSDAMQVRGLTTTPEHTPSIASPLAKDVEAENTILIKEDDVIVEKSPTTPQECTIISSSIENDPGPSSYTKEENLVHTYSKDGALDDSEHAIEITVTHEIEEDSGPSLAILKKTENIEPKANESPKNDDNSIKDTSLNDQAADKSVEDSTKETSEGEKTEETKKEDKNEDPSKTHSNRRSFGSMAELEKADDLDAVLGPETSEEKPKSSFLSCCCSKRKKAPDVNPQSTSIELEVAGEKVVIYE